MNPYKFQLIAGAWGLFLAFLTAAWIFMLRKLGQVLNERLKSTKSPRTISGLPGLFRFIVRGEYKETGDQRLIAVCVRLRQLLYGYAGIFVAYLVFLDVYRPK